MPVVYAAALLRIPTIAHESDYSPGLANRLAAPFLKAFCVTFAETRLAWFRNRPVHTGNPVRTEFLSADPERGKAFIGKGEREILLILGGSQGAETINKIVRTQRQIMSEFGREPTPEELAKKLAMPLEKVRKVLKIAKEPISLETPVGDEDDSHLGDFIEDKLAVQPLEAAIHANLRETTTRILASLTPREERVLRMRFGIGMNTDHTLEEVGQQFSVTRERIRQIEAKALRKLKHPTRSRKLRSFLES